MIPTINAFLFNITRKKTTWHIDWTNQSCESEPKGLQTQRHREFRKENPYTARPKRDGGRWGVAPASEHQEILVALASLIRAQRYDLALIIIHNAI